jgi:predicted amidophosphoribosyltransferase
MELLSGFNEILFPKRCISCSTLGSTLCSDCGSIWSHRKHFQKLTRDSKSSLLVSSSIPYSPIASHILLSAKESNVRKSTQLVILALEHSFQNLLLQQPNLQISALVPIPSRPQVVRARGRDFLQVITQALSIKFQIPTYPILGYSRKVKDQSGLNSEERWNNLNDSLVVRGKAFRGEFPVSEAQGVLLVDDLVTTGATLLAASKALNQAGIMAIGAVTACVAQPLRYDGGRTPF